MDRKSPQLRDAATITPMCRLCENEDTELLYRGAERSRNRDFFHCPVCDLVSVADEDVVDSDEEIKRYGLHENDPDDEEYRNFLGRLFDQLAPQLIPGARGLDFGSGEEGVLALMFEQAGFEMDRYDLYFHQDRSVFSSTYDFIACSETAEHFRQPRVEFDRFNQMLRAGGRLGIMTSMLEDWSEFAEWHYHYDITHICFYSPRTMRWIADRYLWDCNFPRENIVIFRQTG